MATSRSKHLAAVICAALVAAVLLVAPAAEAKPVKRSISIAATPNAAPAGTKVTVAGKLTKSPKGSAVKIQRKVGSTWQLAKATSTKTAAGGYSVQVALPVKVGVYKYRAFAPKKGKLKAATSAVISVAALHKSTFRVIPECSCVVIPVAPGSVADNGPMTVGGAVNSPYSVGAVVALQRKVGTAWVTKGTTTLDTFGRFIASDPHTKTAAYRFVLARKGLNSGATSPTFTVTTAP
jgi:hypothetical protein